MRPVSKNPIALLVLAGLVGAGVTAATGPGAAQTPTYPEAAPPAKPAKSVKKKAAAKPKEKAASKGQPAAKTAAQPATAPATQPVPLARPVAEEAQHVSRYDAAIAPVRIAQNSAQHHRKAQARP